MKTIIIEGKKIDSLAGFVKEFYEATQEYFPPPFTDDQIIEIKKNNPTFTVTQPTKVEKKAHYENLGAFHDWIREFTDKDEEDVAIVINNSDSVQRALGYDEYLRLKNRSLAWCIEKTKTNPEYQKNIDILESEISFAKNKKGETFYGIVIKMILDNPKIHLRLE